MATLNFDVFWKDHGAAAGMKSLGDQADKSAKRLQTFGKIGTAATLAIGAAAVKFGADSIKAYREAEQAQARLQDAFKRFPALADTNIGALRKLNTELANKTRFDDDATASGQAVLAQFKLTGQQITQLTPLLQDYAAKTGKDLPQAAQDLGKAIMGQGRSLKAIGIDFKDTGDKGKNFEQVVKGLRGQVGGFAEKEGKTAAGQIEILKNKFGELQEATGAALAPSLNKVVDQLIKLADWANSTDPSNIEAIAISIAGLAGSLKLLGTSTTAGGIGALVTAMLVLDKKSSSFHNAFQTIGGDLADITDEFILWKATILRGLADVATGWAKINPLMVKPAEALRKMSAAADKELSDVRAQYRKTQKDIQDKPIIAKLNADRRDQERKIRQAKKELNDKDLTRERKAEIKAEIAAARRNIARIKGDIASVKGKTVTVRIVYSQHTTGSRPAAAAGQRGGGQGGFPLRAYGGPITRLAPGGFVPGSSPNIRADNVPILGTAGEFMMQVPATRFWGGGFMNAVNTNDLTQVRQQVGGGSNITYIINAPNYVGDKQDLVKALTDLNRQGRLEVVRR